MLNTIISVGLVIFLLISCQNFSVDANNENIDIQFSNNINRKPRDLITKVYRNCEIFFDGKSMDLSCKPSNQFINILCFRKHFFISFNITDLDIGKLRINNDDYSNLPYIDYLCIKGFIGYIDYYLHWCGYPQWYDYWVVDIPEGNFCFNIEIRYPIN